MQEIVEAVASQGLFLVILDGSERMKFVQALPGGDEGEIEVPAQIQERIRELLRSRGRRAARDIAVGAFEKYGVEWDQVSSGDRSRTYWFPKGGA